MTKPIAYVDHKWPAMWQAMIGGAGLKSVPIGTPLDESAPAMLRGLQYGSEQLLALLMARRHPYWFIDSGYFKAFDAQPRLYYRVVKDAFHQETITPRPRDRWDALGLKIKPWRKEGGHILVCPPASLIVKDLFMGHGWLECVMRTLPIYTDRPVIVRPKYSPGSIYEAGKGAWAVVTHLSNVATDLAIEGIPCFVAHGNAAGPVGNYNLSQIENPLMPDNREEWAASLAYGQFTVEEMASGLAWECVR